MDYLEIFCIGAVAQQRGFLEISDLVFAVMLQESQQRSCVSSSNDAIWVEVSGDLIKVCYSHDQSFLSVVSVSALLGRLTHPQQKAAIRRSDAKMSRAVQALPTHGQDGFGEFWSYLWEFFPSKTLVERSVGTAFRTNDEQGSSLLRLLAKERAQN